MLVRDVRPGNTKKNAASLLLLLLLSAVLTAALVAIPLQEFNKFDLKEISKSIEARRSRIFLLMEEVCCSDGGQCA